MQSKIELPTIRIAGNKQFKLREDLRDQLNNESSIKDLKLAIVKQLGVTVDRQNFIFAGSPLDDDFKLENFYDPGYVGMTFLYLQIEPTKEQKIALLMEDLNEELNGINSKISALGGNEFYKKAIQSNKLSDENISLLKNLADAITETQRTALNF